MCQPQSRLVLKTQNDILTAKMDLFVIASREEVAGPEGS
jgi:hypothetical protein